MQFRWLRTCDGSVLSGYLIFYFCCFLSWTAFAEEQNSLPIWGRSRKSHRLCFGVSVSCWAQQHTAFHTHSGRLFPAYLDEKWIYLPTVSSKCNPTLAGLIWSTVTSTGHLLPVQQLLQLFHFASLYSNVTRVQTAWVSHYFYECRMDSHKTVQTAQKCTIVWQSIER